MSSRCTRLVEYLVVFSALLLIAGCGTVPTITSVPNPMAVAFNSYQYDEDNVATAMGTVPIAWRKEKGPEGFSITTTGEISWIPGTDGEEEVTIVATNAAGSVPQTFKIKVDYPADYRQGKEWGELLRRGEKNGWAILSFLKTNPAEANLEMFGRGFREAVDSQSQNPWDYIIQAAQRSEWDDGCSIGEKLARDEITFQIARGDYRQAYFGSPVKRFAWEAGFLWGYVEEARKAAKDIPDKLVKEKALAVLVAFWDTLGKE